MAFVRLFHLTNIAHPIKFVVSELNESDTGSDNEKSNVKPKMALITGSGAEIFFFADKTNLQFW